MRVRRPSSTRIIGKSSGASPKSATHSHGATVGKTDPAQKFYLLSRGLDSQTADRLDEFRDAGAEVQVVETKVPALDGGDAIVVKRVTIR